MAQVKTSRFQEIRANCLATGLRYEDPEFPAVPKSIYFSRNERAIQWHRPFELFRDPKFIYKDHSRFDAHQGALGDCWFVAAAAVLASRPELFHAVVPNDQQFDEDYAGVFHFNFWCFGVWREVIIDDRLPTYKAQDGTQRLAFCANRDRPDEFWPALLEKAYAKLFGSYEALEGGFTVDALVDLTGGIGYRINLTKKHKLPRDLFAELQLVDSLSTLMACSINSTQETLETVLANGLVIGHAYSITRLLQITDGDEQHQLLRLRNPWGEKEWNGAWSDRSTEWLNMGQDKREQLGIVCEEDGEFWMSFEDWVTNFDMLHQCYLPPDHSLTGHGDWKELSFTGSWVRGVNAGSSIWRPNSGNYWSNSQYRVQLKVPDRSVFDRRTFLPDSDKCSLVVSLMQKDSRRNRTLYSGRRTEVAMTFDLYKVNDDQVNVNRAHFDKSALQLASRRYSKYRHYRDISDYFYLDPGLYVIIPSSYTSRDEADYLLRVYTASTADGSELDSVTEPINKPSIPRGDTLHELFDHYAGSQKVIDHRELQLVLNRAFSQELGKDHSFDLETCRSLLSMFDENRSGVLGVSEVERLWHELMVWKFAFYQFDNDESGFIDVSELKNVFESVGYKLSALVLKAVVRRFGGKEGKLAFNEFALALTKVVTLVDKFASLTTEGLDDKVQLSRDELLEVLMYF